MTRVSMTFSPPISRALRVFLVWLLCLALAGCPKKPAGDAPIVVREDSAGLLLTWIDEKGDFHVEQKVVDVPSAARESVRVIDPKVDDGTGNDRIFVADLRTVRADGTYPVRITTR